MSDWVLVAYVAGALLTWCSLERSVASRRMTPAMFGFIVFAWPAVWVLGSLAGLFVAARDFVRSRRRRPPGQTEG